MRTIKRLFALLVTAPLFVLLAYTFGIFLRPQGQGGWIAAVLLILASALASLYVYGWIMRGARTAPMNRGHDDGGGLGVGLLGASASGRRRRDDHDGDDFGARRRDAANNDDGSANDDPSGII